MKSDYTPPVSVKCESCGQNNDPEVMFPISAEGINYACGNCVMEKIESGEWKVVDG